MRTYTVRPTDIDFGQHMNNVAYIRVLLDCFSAAQIASGKIASIEAHYAAPCLEGETLSVYRKPEGEISTVLPDTLPVFCSILTSSILLMIKNRAKD